MPQSFVGVPAVYPKLIELRKSKTAEFRPNNLLKAETKLRYYQVVGSLHMMLLDRMVLGDGTGLGKCVSEDTYINTSKGFMKIGSFLEDDPEEDHLYDLAGFKVLSLEGAHPADKIYHCGIKNGLRIITNQGFSLTGLSHHPVLCPCESGRDYKHLSHLKIGDMVCINRKGLFPESFQNLSVPNTSVNAHSYKMPVCLDERFAELLGYYVSESQSSCPWTFQITQFEKETHLRIRFLLKDLFGYEQNDIGNPGYDKEIIINSVQIRQLFLDNGVAMNGRSGGQVVPSKILQSPKGVVRSFLHAYFEGDGGVEKSSRGVSCCSKSAELIRQIQLLLLSFGIVSKRKLKMVKVRGERRPYWRLYFFGKDVNLFEQEIGFFSSRKRAELRSISMISHNTNKDFIPFGNSLLKQALSDIIRYLRERPDQKGFSVKGSGWKGLVGRSYKEKLEAYVYGKRKLTYDGLREFVETVSRLKLTEQISNMALLQDILDKNIFFDRITEKVPVRARFYDFHVPETHNFTGDGFINHNTIESIAAYTWLLSHDPTLKLLVVTIKSAAGQWKEEFEKFTTGISVRILENKYEGLQFQKAREKQYQDFSEAVFIITYATTQTEYDSVVNAMGNNFMVFFDECSAFKNRKSKTHFGCKYIAEKARRAYGLSATIIKNGLEEVYGIYDVVVPGLFGRITKFRDTFCELEMMDLIIKGKRRKIPKVVGYKNLQQFKNVLDPYFLIRRKEDVADELPKLISKKIMLEMGDEQKQVYKEALAGILYEEKIKQEFFEVMDRVRNGVADEKTMALYEERKEKYEKFLSPEGKKRGKLAAVTYCQMISNGPSLVKRSGESSKEEEFERLMLEELSNEKVILFTRFKSGIPNLEIVCERKHISYTKITGDDSLRERDIARNKFQTDPTCNLIFITTAGSAALNLQSAGVIIFYDTPWSYGDLVQTIGRAQRIGSIQEHVLLIHLVNKGTIDVRVINRVSDKKELSTEILGDTAEGALDFTAREENAIDDLYECLLKDAEE